MATNSYNKKPSELLKLASNSSKSKVTGYNSAPSSLLRTASSSYKAPSVVTNKQPSSVLNTARNSNTNRAIASSYNKAPASTLNTASEMAQAVKTKANERKYSSTVNHGPVQPAPAQTYTPAQSPTRKVSNTPVQTGNAASTRVQTASNTQVSPVVVDPMEEKKAQAEQYASEVNNVSEQVANGINDLPLSRSSQAINNLYNSIESGDGEYPQAPNFMDLYNETRQQLGIDMDEQDLADIDNEIEQLRVREMVDSDIAGDRPVSMQQIERRRGTISREAQRQLAFLDVERSAIARTVQGKTDAMKMIMDFTQQDYANASQAYQNNFNRNLQTIQLLQGQEDRETSAVTRLQDTAKANISTVMSMMTESGKTYDDLPANQKAQLQQWELQAGFPAGLLQSLPPEQGKLMTLGNNLVRIYPDDTIKVVYSKPASGGSGGSGGSSTIKLTTANKTKLLASGFNAAQISNIESYVSQNGLEALASSEGITEDQLKAINDAYKGSKISGTPDYKAKGFKNLDNNPLFGGKSRRAKLNEGGIDDNMIAQAEEYINLGHNSKQIANALGLSTQQKLLLDEYIELN